ncbi:uncharacterized protein LOC126685778 [Mercurialis annua]|uniref:uncharacterized protein LOC126685778 n=1 Tax=Mercurialis annua TaxID=3986 RepID=UPI002160CAD8|nr:uncharacterized protein LOC126685778 [Mercurialis annua]
MSSASNPPSSATATAATRPFSTTTATATATALYQLYQPRPQTQQGGVMGRAVVPNCNPHPHPHPLLMRQHPHHYAAAPIKGIPLSDSNGCKNTRERSKDDNFVVAKDRKVRISQESSLYGLCRSWLRNGFPQDNQPQYGDVVKVLPKPLPMSDVHPHSLGKEGEEVVEEDEQEEESVDNLSAEDLLRRHIKRAKKVRARLREKRLKRIARYKTRLAMLLPPQVEHFRNDTAAGN